jgi:hypothetical protein
MALNALYFSLAPIAHVSGRVYAPIGNICTVPAADALTLATGGGLPLAGTMPPPSTIFPNQQLPQNNLSGAPVFLTWSGATSDRWVQNSATQGFAPPPYGTPFYDSTLGEQLWWVGPAVSSTGFVTMAGASA